MGTFRLVSGNTGDRTSSSDGFLSVTCAEEEETQERKSRFCLGEKSPRQGDDDIVPGNTLTGRQASGGIGTFRKEGTPVDSRLEQNLIFLRKGNRGMPMKPIGRFQQLLKTSQGSEASRG